MPNPLDLDQLNTFIAIAETGSFTRAAEQVFKTQSAVSMQMRRLEERIGQPIFVKDGRINRLSDDGEKLLDYARKMLKLNDETINAFSGEQLEGSIRFGTPDDYADRFMPSIIAQFAQTHPNIELNVICEPSRELHSRMDNNELDVALVTHGDVNYLSEVIRTEPLYWVTSHNHMVHEEKVIPLAIGRDGCCWGDVSFAALDKANRDYRVIVASHSATVIASAVLAGLAVAPLPECALQYGMRILTEADNFPQIGMTKIGLLKRPGAAPTLVEALSKHIIASLDNITPNGTKSQLVNQPNGQSGDLLAHNNAVNAAAGSKFTW
ncbi:MULTISPECIES: LysR substrate-binding domain-containing protein [unclassified Lentilitoribacter]|uniref:LysR substrate-binding domain-containing protein n=1 Tax=unclassified Lentilitoribacter TaxID=2647570 RepID=UPI0013A6BF7C|nr:LysR substrate-binding domain-containing protein [Lentilitoribacter sp. Alg239-R112]